MKKFLSEVSFWAQAIPLSIIIIVWYLIIFAAMTAVAGVILGIIGFVTYPILYHIAYFFYWLTGGH